MNTVKKIPFWHDIFGKKRITALEKEVEALRAENVGYKTLTEILKEESGVAEQKAHDYYIELSRMSLTKDTLYSAVTITEKINELYGYRKLNHQDRKAVYNAVRTKLDPDGAILLTVAKNILGPFDESMFPYEANIGMFEGSAFGENGTLRALLIQYSGKLGQPAKKRWVPAQTAGAYERCMDWSIDETTPEYQKFEHELYVRVFGYLCTGYMMPFQIVED